MTFELEKYLDNLTLSTRIAMCRFRLWYHSLKIETGGYKQERIERSMRKCQLCNHQDIEDEYHFLLICPVYSDTKYQFRQGKCLQVCLSYGQLDIFVWKKLGRYPDESFKLRKSFV